MDEYIYIKRMEKSILNAAKYSNAIYNSKYISEHFSKTYMLLCVVVCLYRKGILL